jgi:hypothetical protein
VIWENEDVLSNTMGKGGAAMRSKLAGCGKTRLLHNTSRSAHVACWYQNSAQDAQKGRPARPQREKRRIVLLPYGEPLNDARTPLADFFRILLEQWGVQAAMGLYQVAFEY